VAGELPAQGAHSSLTAKSRDLANRGGPIGGGPRQAEVAPFPAPVPDYSEGMVDLATAHATHAPRTGRSHSFAAQLAGLLHPSGELSFVELVVLVDVEVAHFLLRGLAGDQRTGAFGDARRR
jgi:hypothetical protein